MRYRQVRAKKLHSAEMMSISEKYRNRSALGISNECDRVTIFKIVSPLPVLQSSCYSLFKRHRCKVSLSTITLRVDEGAVAGAALCQAHVGVIGIEEKLTALVNIDHQLNTFLIEKYGTKILLNRKI